ncbi:MAG: winged helix DNA-binding domain-containing protein, partial [Chloroflexi bacterium]|nr:winged helix DNA-binding domain-containing protein [Chloroflexota bacterium]
MTPADIASLRLWNQHLLQADFSRPQEVVDWLVAVQSQDYTGAKWSVGQRMPTATDAVLDEAFNTGAILRTHVLRPTWHFVAPADIRWLLMLTA